MWDVCLCYRRANNTEGEEEPSPQNLSACYRNCAAATSNQSFILQSLWFYWRLATVFVHGKNLWWKTNSNKNHNVTPDLGGKSSLFFLLYEKVCLKIHNVKAPRGCWTKTSFQSSPCFSWDATAAEPHWNTGRFEAPRRWTRQRCSCTLLWPAWTASSWSRCPGMQREWRRWDRGWWSWATLCPWTADKPTGENMSARTGLFHNTSAACKRASIGKVLGPTGWCHHHVTSLLHYSTKALKCHIVMPSRARWCDTPIDEDGTRQYRIIQALASSSKLLPCWESVCVCVCVTVSDPDSAKLNLNVKRLPSSNEPGWAPAPSAATPRGQRQSPSRTPR